MSTPSDEVGEKLATALGEGPSRATLAAQRVLVIEMAQRAFRPRPRPSVWTYSLAGALVVAAVVAFGAYSTRPRAFDARFRGAAIDVEARLVAKDQAADALDFSDGSQVVLERSARATLSSLTSKHAGLRLETGRVTASIRKHPGMTWTVAAGPYEVTVIGTRFSVEWDERTSAFEVLVREGRVRVTGGDLPASGVVLDPGGRLERRALLPAAPAAPEARSDGDARRTADEPATEKGVDVVPTASAGADVGALASKGKYKEALALAEKQGFSRLLGELPENDLLLLANAARFSGNAARAREALMKLRQRFAGRPAASLAALYLAKIAEDMTREPGEAIRWLRVFLEESPNGDLAAGARASLMSLLLRNGQKSEARTVAAEYLRRHPSGSRVDEARALAGE